MDTGSGVCIRPSQKKHFLTFVVAQCTDLHKIYFVVVLIFYVATLYENVSRFLAPENCPSWKRAREERELGGMNEGSSTKGKGINLPVGTKRGTINCTSLNRLPLTFYPWRLFSHECISHVFRHSCVCPSSEDPGTGGLGGLQKALPKATLQSGKEVFNAWRRMASGKNNF